MIKLLPFLALCTALAACNWAEHKTKSALNKGGELAGSAATEVIEGVTTGVERTWSVDVSLSDTLLKRGLKLGKVSSEIGLDGRENRVILYISAALAFNDTISAVAFDKDGLEMGRTRIAIEASAGSGEFHEVQFQRFTDLERKSRVELY
jgi:hypothetical protein